MRLSPRPVSMLFAGRLVSVDAPSASTDWSYCVNTRFQNSRKRSLSPPGRSVGRAELEPAVEVQLRARPARPGRAGLPEVLLARAFHDPPARDPDLLPEGDRLLVGTEPQRLVAGEHRHPDVVLGEAEHLPRELPRELDRLALEVVAEREVPEHLEERQVPCRVADVVDVDRPEALLTARQPLRRRLFLAEEVRLQRVHPRDRQERRGIVRGGHERGGGDARVPALLEEGQVALADLVGGHRAGDLRDHSPTDRADGRAAHQDQ